MTLLDRIAARRCAKPGCDRTTHRTEQGTVLAYCDAHTEALLREPRWRKWTREHGAGKDLTRAA